MEKYKRYIGQVNEWKGQLKQLLQGEKVERENPIWVHLDELTNMLQGINNLESMDENQLLILQNKVEEVHEEMEQYFANRHLIGSIYLLNQGVPIGKHSLPPLPYSYDALEPYISEEIMRLHHLKHHQSYVDGLNKAEKKLAEAREKGDYSLVKHWSRELAFNGSGHYLHTIFWNNMTPHGQQKPTGKLLKEIEKYFGSFEQFQKHFTEAAKAVEGVGWAVLVWSPRARHLEILQSEKHMNLTQWDTIPLLVLDVWEHAYYLQYKNDRGEYVKNWWNVVNWQDVEERFEKASQLTWKPY